MTDFRQPVVSAHCFLPFRRTLCHARSSQWADVLPADVHTSLVSLPKWGVERVIVLLWGTHVPLQNESWLTRELTTVRDMEAFWYRPFLLRVWHTSPQTIPPSPPIKVNPLDLGQGKCATHFKRPLPGSNGTITPPPQCESRSVGGGLSIICILWRIFIALLYTFNPGHLLSTLLTSKLGYMNLNPNQKHFFTCTVYQIICNVASALGLELIWCDGYLYCIS